MTTDPTETDYRSLATKLEGLDLTDAEITILESILDRAAGSEPDDVAGFLLLPAVQRAVTQPDATGSKLVINLSLGWDPSSTGS